MSEHYPIPTHSEDALLQFIDKATSEIERWQHMREVAVGRLACASGQEVLWNER